MAIPTECSDAGHSRVREQRAGHLQMPDDLSVATEGGSVSSALLPFFVPWLRWLALSRWFGGRLGFWAGWGWEGCDGKIKAMPRRHAQVIVCTSFFRETRPRAIEIAFSKSACNQRFTESIARQVVQLAQISAVSAHLHALRRAIVL